MTGIIILQIIHTKLFIVFVFRTASHSIPGTEQTDSGISICDQLTGNCRCKPNVKGRDCNECQNGYYNIVSGNGCENCNCDPIGSFNSSCDRTTGQCYCKPGVTG